MLNINNENVKDSLNKNNIKNKVDGSKKNSKMDKNSILSTFVLHYPILLLLHEHIHSHSNYLL